jgi:DNA-binding GntR family transcriptional regulator
MPEAVSQRIFRSLKDDILKGVLPPGLQIRQEALAEQFGVSRVPVREALRQLESEGLLTSELHKGAFVSNRSLDEVEEMLDIRIALELRALKLALPHMTPDVVAAAKNILRTYDRSGDPLEWRDLNVAFHMTLYKPCNRQRLLKMIEDVVLVNYRFLRTYISITVGRDEPQDEHHKILDACAAHNSELALQLLETHMEHTRGALQKKRASQTASDLSARKPATLPPTHR